jgi:hypothetical protein
LSVISENPTQIITHIESNLTAEQYPVFLFTFADLLDLSEVILSLLTYRPDCTLLFIAEGSMIPAMQFINESQTNYMKTELQKGSSLLGYKFFAFCVRSLQRTLHYPVAVINPPHV